MNKYIVLYRESDDYPGNPPLAPAGPEGRLCGADETAEAGASRAEAGGTGRAHWQAPVRRNEAQGRALITTQERDMGQITEDFILRAMRQCQLGRHPPMTVWEVRQLLTAWVEWQACREDAERYRWLRGQDWIDDSIMNEYLIAPEIPSTLDRAFDAERKRRASLPTGDV